MNENDADHGGWAGSTNFWMLKGGNKEADSVHSNQYSMANVK